MRLADWCGCGAAAGKAGAADVRSAPFGPRRATVLPRRLCRPRHGVRPGHRTLHSRWSLSSRDEVSARPSRGCRSAPRCPTAGPSPARRPGGCCSRRRARARRASAMPGASWPQPCGTLTTPGMMASVTSTGTSRRPTRERTRAGRAVGEAEAGGVVGMHPQRAARPARARAARCCASRSCSSAGRGGRPASCAPPGRVRRERSRGTSAVISAAPARSSPTACAAPRGCAGASAPRSTPCGDRARAPPSESPSGRAPNAVAVRAGAQHDVEQALRAAARRQRGQQLGRLASLHAASRCPDGALQLLERDEVVERVGVGVGSLTHDDAGRAAGWSPSRSAGPAAARTRAASSWRSCGWRAARAPRS